MITFILLVIFVSPFLFFHEIRSHSEAKAKKAKKMERLRIPRSNVDDEWFIGVKK